MCTDQPINREEAGELGHIKLAVDGGHGIYCGQEFAYRYGDELLAAGMPQNDFETLITGPEDEYYSEVCDELDDYTLVGDNGVRWGIMWDNGDIFLYRADIDIDWEL